MRTSRVGGTRRLLAVGTMALGSLGLAGCTAARNTLGTNSSPCFRALALAEDAVFDRGDFTGVRLVAASSLRKLPHFDSVLNSRSSTPLHNVCLVSYRGTYRLEEVKRAAGRAPPSGVGHFAVVVVSSPQNVLLATFVLEKEPLRFLHLTLGRVERSTAPGGDSRVG